MCLHWDGTGSRRRSGRQRAQAHLQGSWEPKPVAEAPQESAQGSGSCLWGRCLQMGEAPMEKLLLRSPRAASHAAVGGREGVGGWEARVLFSTCALTSQLMLPLKKKPQVSLRGQQAKPVALLK